MGEVRKLDILKWGPNIVDIRNLSKYTFVADCEDASKAAGYGTPLKQSVAEQILKNTIDACPPGVIFASNPHYGIYAKWDNLFIKAGFKMASKLCAINRVYAKKWDWKSKPGFGSYTKDQLAKLPKYESPDGYQHWIHAMYMVKEPVPTKLTFDFENFNGASGDTDGFKMWSVGYGTRATAPKAKDGYSYIFEKAYARLAHNCGCAMGYGKPQNGKLVDEEFYTIMALPEDEIMPAGYARFLRAGGLKFGHNLKKLVGDTATECFHRFDVL